MVIYDSADIYIDSATDLQGKITKIDNIINSLLSVAAKAAANDYISEYAVDDGQTKIASKYRGASSVFNAIRDFERLKQLYVNKLNGRMVRLVDAKNFPGQC